MDDAVVLLGAVSGLLGAAAVFLNRRRTRRGDPAATRIDVLTTRYLGGKKMLTVVDVEGERLLLALSGNTVRLVTRLGRRRTAPAADLALLAAEALGGEEARPAPEGRGEA
jgi:flagellar biogenesis protein FliO